MKTININEHITATISEKTLAALERDALYWTLYSRYLNETDYWLDYDEPMSDYPDWFDTYRPIEVIQMVK